MSPEAAEEIRASLRALLGALDRVDDLDGPGLDDRIYQATKARARAAIAATDTSNSDG